MSEPPAVPASDLWGLIPRPIAVAVAVFLIISYAWAEISGKLKGPITWLLSRTERKTATEHQERDRRVEELEKSLKFNDDRIERVLTEAKRLGEQVEAQVEEIRWLHRLNDAQARAIRAHTAWDNSWLPQLREALPHVNIPDPPDLYVELEEPR